MGFDGMISSNEPGTHQKSRERLRDGQKTASYLVRQDYRPTSEGQLTDKVSKNLLREIGRHRLNYVREVLFKFRSRYIAVRQTKNQNKNKTYSLTFRSHLSNSVLDTATNF